MDDNVLLLKLPIDRHTNGQNYPQMTCNTQLQVFLSQPSEPSVPLVTTGGGARKHPERARATPLLQDVALAEPMTHTGPSSRQLICCSSQQTWQHQPSYRLGTAKSLKTQS